MRDFDVISAGKHWICFSQIISKINRDIIISQNFQKTVMNIKHERKERDNAAELIIYSSDKNSKQKELKKEVSEQFPHQAVQNRLHS